MAFTFYRLTVVLFGWVNLSLVCDSIRSLVWWFNRCPHQSITPMGFFNFWIFCSEYWFGSLFHLFSWIAILVSENQQLRILWRQTKSQGRSLSRPGTWTQPSLFWLEEYFHLKLFSLNFSLSLPQSGSISSTTSLGSSFWSSSSLLSLALK